MDSGPPTVVWFKRDLRIEDHRPLAAAVRQGRIIPLFILEPDWVALEDTSRRHVRFLLQTLRELSRTLAARGAPLVVRIGEAVPVLEALRRETGFEAIHAHEETGNGWTYDRDRAVLAWCAGAGVTLREWPRDGVVRRLSDRDGWSRRWLKRMKREIEPTPEHIASVSGVAGDTIPELETLPVQADGEDDALLQDGGRAEAEHTLESFLNLRGAPYTKGMSSPVTAFEACSRISPYLAWGCFSMREVYQRTRERVAELRALRAAGEAPEGPWLGAMSSFEKRLRWHCHFMQKLEDEPELEWRNLARVYDGLREEDWDETRFAAWRDGRTGYPLIDACMRALTATGWINFRMRAMLMSFASYHLWLHWRETGLHLARLFTDYEPGIHWAQTQMQSGTTGINTIRIYSPIKQVQDQDPEGIFIRRWVPELAELPDGCLPRPERTPPLIQIASNCRIGEDYPAPIVPHEEAVRAAKDRVWAVRKSAEAREQAQVVYERHGSRKRPSSGGRREA